ncbi:hypothetical protein, partial [Ruminococcus sp. AM31-15AC]|uniref:hypothetical protein n=1 Tax=Ruminococcus sp. AM31-15AC TaxID=2293202 RepID=UPI000E91BAC6
DREKAPWATYCSYDIYEAVPCWVFYFDETPNKEIYATINCNDMTFLLLIIKKETYNTIKSDLSKSENYH